MAADAGRKRDVPGGELLSSIDATRDVRDVVPQPEASRPTAVIVTSSATGRGTGCSGR